MIYTSQTMLRPDNSMRMVFATRATNPASSEISTRQVNGKSVISRRRSVSWFESNRYEFY